MTTTMGGDDEAMEACVSRLADSPSTWLHSFSACSDRHFAACISLRLPIAQSNYDNNNEIASEEAATAVKLQL
jgi:hypothetical protein